MDPNASAEELPALYRAILDRVAELEAAGDRVEAGRVRRDAIRAYARAWDDRARRQLEALLRRASRETPGERRVGRRSGTGARDLLGRTRARTRAAATPDR